MRAYSELKSIVWTIKVKLTENKFSRATAKMISSQFIQYLGTILIPTLFALEGLHTYLRDTEKLERRDILESIACITSLERFCCKFV